MEPEPGTEATVPEADQSPHRVTTGLVGWWNRRTWRRAARGVAESEVDELRKRVVIINRQLDGLPDSSRVFKRRMELLRDRERCETIIAAWERNHGS